MLEELMRVKTALYALMHATTKKGNVIHIRKDRDDLIAASVNIINNS